jgi:hypothetical protein
MGKYERAAEVMRFAWWIIKATNTPSEYVILITAFLRQRWLGESFSVLSYTYIACLVCFYFRPYSVM